MLKVINALVVPEAIGPYSQAILFNEILFTSGQIPINPATNTLIEGEIDAQVEQVMKNI